MSEASAGNQSPQAPSSAARGRIRYRQAPPPVAYANVFEVRGGVDEILITLGYGQAGRVRGRGPGGDAETMNELLIDPTHRVALTPQAAKRLAMALTQSVALLEARAKDSPAVKVERPTLTLKPRPQPVTADA